MNKTVSIVVPCFNEQDNVRPLCEKLFEISRTLNAVDLEVLFIDNASTDDTVGQLKRLIRDIPDLRIKIIVNNRNFGPVRSPVHALLQATGDAAILMAADFQEPPDLIPSFIEEWRKGEVLVAGIKTTSVESKLKFFLRKSYYNFLSHVSEVPLLKQFTGFGLYDRQVIEAIRGCCDPYPYLRGLISELGYQPKQLTYHQVGRKSGMAKGNVRNMINFGLLGFVSHSKIPLRLAIWLGFASAFVCGAIAVFYLFYKLAFWNEFQLGVAPLIIGLFFFGSVQMLFLGIVGEYVTTILTHVKRYPLVVEKERINF